MRAVSPRGAQVFFRMLGSLPFGEERRRPRARGGGWLARFVERSVAPPQHRRVRQTFLVALGGIYFIAFTSLGRQVLGLHGSRGILPVKDLLGSPRLVALGRERYLKLPTVFWRDASDAALGRGIRAGQALSLAVMLGVAPQASLAGLWALYLSYVSVGREFLSFQWDALLLEMGLLAVLTAPAGLRPGAGLREPTALEVFAWRMLVFRLYLGSGLSKIQSGDRTWRELTACDVYYETAPLPTRGGWAAHQLPRRVQRYSTLSVLALETVFPFLVFAPRPLRLLTFWLLSGLQGVILVTGNYGFFNVQSLALGLWLLDDTALGRVLPEPPPARPRALWRTAVGALSVAPPLALGALELLGRFDRPRRVPDWLAWLERRARPLRAVNGYGLFAVMTVRRPEISLEGSEDGRTWREYPFRYKVGALEQPPRWVAPHQPRLDWQMWFAALGSPPAWLLALTVRLLEGVPEVEGLFAGNPFPGQPPRFIRAVLYDYRMTDRETRRSTGAWWTRERTGLYLPPVSLAPPGATHRLEWAAEA
ncbi:lipase maturation factor family protein [Cystobacter fuscus]|uniref:lipase maturation factor family protein n=1 Tax=Cystobacter fuscus TaxID=43 RepID=UPI002B2DBE21|nr:lipase maturation factor family protein [Cystobacter fuscus]